LVARQKRVFGGQREKAHLRALSEIINSDV